MQLPPVVPEKLNKVARLVAVGVDDLATSPRRFGSLHDPKYAAKSYSAISTATFSPLAS